MALSEEAIRRLVYQSCMTLDAEDFDGYLTLCGPGYRYRITTYSPELKKDMVWLDHGRKDLASMLEMVPQHVRLPGRFLRHATVQVVGHGERPDEWTAVSALSVYYTDPDGESRLFAVGRYHDRIEEADGSPRLAAREVRLETRVLGAGSHLPM
jgi:methanesulfonate monooxygenase small subunit